ncbi:uncharacterized protein TNCV_3800341 [Trichonephila clavipes]|nr:uncharacterized protein TNCV_3800341 [Trichonephila clavipes]
MLRKKRIEWHGEDILWKNGDAGINSEVSCDNGIDKSFSKHNTAVTVTLPQVRSNSWEAQLAVPNHPDMLDWRQIWVICLQSSISGYRVGQGRRTWFHSVAVQFPRSPHNSKRWRRWVGVKDSQCNGCSDPKCPSARYLHMVREDTYAPSEGAIYSWMAADEAVGCTCAFLTMWWTSQRLVCRGRPGSGLRVNNIYRIYWSQQFLTTQSKRPY